MIPKKLLHGTSARKISGESFPLGLYGGKGFDHKGGFRKKGEAETAKTLGPPVYNYDK